MRCFLGFFRGNYFFRVLVLAFCFAATVSWGIATAAEMSPETQALFRAVNAGDMRTVKKTLLAGADVNGENANGLTPVDVAIDENYFKIAHYLLAWRKHRQSARPPRITLAPQPTPEPPAPAQPVPESPRSYVVRTEPPTPLPPAPVQPEPPAPVQPEPPAPTQPVPEPPRPTVVEAEPSTPPPAPAQPVPEPPRPTVVEAEPSTPPPAPAQPVQPAPSTSQSSTTAETNSSPRPSPPERASATTGPPEPATENTVAAPASKAEIPPQAAPEPAQGIFKRVTDFFSFKSEDDGASAAKAPEIRTVPETTPESTPVKTSVGEAKPATAEAPAAEAETEQDVMKRITDFFSFKSEGAETQPEPVQIAAAPPEPVQAVAPEPAPAAREAETTAKTGPDMMERITDFFSFKSKVDDTPPTPTVSPAIRPEGGITETAGLSPSARAETGKTFSGKRIQPVLGRSLRLGKPLASGTGDVCIEKSSPNFWFCIEPVDWPDEIAGAFQVRTSLYRGAKTIVRYENGGASQFHTLFPTGNFEAIVGYFDARLGAPGQRINDWAILAGESNRKNRTVRWRGAGNSVLEIREIDDLRWSSMPDTQHGVVRMYTEDADSVFRHVSWSDFMLAKIHSMGR